jgi:hypothetical protein
MEPQMMMPTMNMGMPQMPMPMQPPQFDIGKLLSNVAIQQTQQQGNSQGGLPQIMSMGADALIKGMTKKMQEHGEALAQPFSSAIIQSFMNPQQQAMPQNAIPSNPTPNPGNPPPDNSKGTFGGGKTEGTGAGGGFDDNTSNSTPSTKPTAKDNSASAKKGSNWGLALIGLGAGLQGKDPGEAIYNALKASGKEPMQEKDKLQYYIDLRNKQIDALQNAMKASIDQEKAAYDKINSVSSLISPIDKNLRQGLKNKEVQNALNEAKTAHSARGSILQSLTDVLNSPTPMPGDKSQSNNKLDVGSMLYGEKILKVTPITNKGK